MKDQMALMQEDEIRIGILGSKNERESAKEKKFIGPAPQSDITNAEIGAKQELGSRVERIPARSFLRMPMEEKMPEELEKIGGNRIFKKIMKKGALETLREIGMIAEGQIDKAFKSSGFGTWAPNSPYTQWLKKSSRPLIDTGKLRRAVTSVVEKKGAK